MKNPLDDPTEMKNAITDSLQWQKQTSEEAGRSASSTLRKLLETQRTLKEMKSTDIHFSPPILTRDDAAVFFPSTINTIQGQTGAHKSRFAEVICSALLKRQNCNRPLLNFDRQDSNRNFHVVYVDTERNLKEQFPTALQNILKGAGYCKEDNPPTFHYISLLMEERGKRFEALNEYLKHLRTTTDAPLFVVLDVTSDCVEDFNRVDKSMELIDMMGRSINENDVTFLCVLHENPGSEKMRGHLGTELSNKSTTVIQIAYVKDSSNNDTHVLKVTFKKCRSTKRHEPFFIKYSEVGNELVLADEIDLHTIDNARKIKANTLEMTEALTELLGNQQRLQRALLIKALCKRTGASTNTIENRLKGLWETKTIIPDINDVHCTLSNSRDKGVRNKVYFLTPILDTANSKSESSQSQPLI
jgi:hypothetical protein